MILNVTNMTIEYGKNILLKDVNFSLEKGTINLIIGENGSGKSSIIKALIRDSSFKGDCRYKSIKYMGKEVSDFVSFRREISYIPQECRVNHFVLNSPIDELRYVAKLSNQYKNSNQIEDKIEELLNFFDKNNKIKNAKGIGYLSGGERGVLNIMTGLMKKDAKLLLIDEPINNLDSLNAVRVSNFLTNYANKKDVAILIVTHCKMFPKIDKTFIIKDKELQPELNYQYEDCFGKAINGIYQINE